MTWKRRAIIFSLAGLLALFSAFSLGRMVAADTNTGPAPGSAEDPLVSRSYVDLKTSEAVKTLEGRIKALEERVAELERKLGSNPVTPPDTGTPPSSSEQKVYTRAGKNWANIRTEPSTSAALLTRCYPGTAMTLLATQGDWYKVKMPDGKVGWVHNSVAEIRSAGGGTTPSSEQKVYTRAGKNWANIRTGPSTSAALLTRCYPGTAMTLLATQGDWYNVKMPDGKVGWVHNSVAEIR